MGIGWRKVNSSYIAYMHLRYRAFVLCTIVFVSLAPTHAQDEVIDKNGRSLGSRKELVQACVKEFKEDPSSAHMDHVRACNCFFDLIPLIDSEAQGPNGEEATTYLEMLVSDSAATLSFIKCVESSVKTDVPLSKFGTPVIERMINECSAEMAALPEMKASGVDGVGTCRCVFEESRRKGLTLADVNNMSDESSVHFNEIMIPCIQRNVVQTTSGRQLGSPDVSGKKNTDVVPLMNIGQVFKVKARIGGIEKYFILDSGASDCMIPASFEKELKEKQALRTDQYLEPSPYTLADGRVVTCRRFVIGSMVIGEFTVKNVTVGVIDEESTFLLGKSFLDKFEEWTVDPRASTLYLKRR